MSKQDNKKSVTVVLPISAEHQKIKAVSTANNYEFRTHKLAVESTIAIGKDGAIAGLLDDKLTVTVTRISAGIRNTKVAELSLAMVLAFASNGVFEQFNTNLKTDGDFADQWDAVTNNYLYKSDYQLSLKSPEKDNSFRAFLVAVMAQESPVTIDDEHKATITRNVIAKGLRLEKGKAPTAEQTAAALSDEKVISFGITQLAKLEIQLLKLWSWLEPALTENGYARSELKADDLL